MLRLLQVVLLLLLPLYGYGGNDSFVLVNEKEAVAGASSYMDKLLKGEKLTVSFFREKHRGHNLDETEARKLYCDEILENEGCENLFQRMSKEGESSFFLKWLSHYLRSHGSTFDIVGAKFQKQSETFCKYVIAGRIGSLNVTLQHYSCSDTLNLEGEVSITYINGIPLKNEILEYGIEYEKDNS